METTTSPYPLQLSGEFSPRLSRGESLAVS
jgi:hypothetical protein